MLPKTPITEYSCSQCGTVMDHAAGLQDEPLPVEGDICLCLKCGHATLFTAGLEGVREISAEEWEAIKSDAEAWAAIRDARKVIREQRRKGKREE